ncbi:hypothetical protein QFZ43_000674 [Streptomyces afghaniensis]|nr:hypothetical protein [Streptomyces afghaniensis]MDQ1014125.1 hypothetical protein [Streptomyces afghaniensis]
MRLGGGVQPAAAPETVLVGEGRVIGVRVEDSHHAAATVLRPFQSPPVQAQPLLGPRIEVGHHQLGLGGEVVVQAHLRHACLGGDLSIPVTATPAAQKRRAAAASSFSRVVPRCLGRSAAVPVSLMTLPLIARSAPATSAPSLSLTSP